MTPSELAEGVSEESMLGAFAFVHEEDLPTGSLKFDSLWAHAFYSSCE